MARKTLIEFRRGTAAAWTAANPTLAAGEPGWESDTNKLKFGDGATAWNALAYFNPGGGGGTVTNVSSANSSIVVTNPTTTPSLTLAALNTLTSNAAVGADWSNNSHKITSVTDPTNPQDAATKNYVDTTAGGGVVVAADGWVNDTAETWTFASFAAGPPAVGTFTVATNLTAKYTMGTRIKMTQTTTKYFVVSAAPTFGGGNTTVTISGGTDFTLANAAISGNFHSYVVNPQGWPSWFTFASGVTGYASTTSNTVRFQVIDRICSIFALIQGTSNAASTTIVLPIAAAQTSAYGGCIVNNAGTIAGGRLDTANGSTTGTARSTVGGGTWSTTAAKGLGDATGRGTNLVSYEI